MRGVLLIGHGSRDSEGNAGFESFFTALRDKLPEEPVRACYLEHAQPDVLAGVAACCADGVTELVVMPLMLFAAGHAKRDIPLAIEKAQLKFPAIKILYAQPIGANLRLVDVLVENLAELGLCSTADGADAAIVFVGRGSSDPMVQASVEALGEGLSLRFPETRLEVAYMAMCEPKTEVVLDQMLSNASLKPKRIFLVPHLLFTGILLKRLETLALKLQFENPLLKCLVSRPLGQHGFVLDAVCGRIDQARIKCSEPSR